MKENQLVCWKYNFSLDKAYQNNDHMRSLLTLSGSLEMKNKY